MQFVHVGRPARAARRARALWGIEGTSGARFLLLRAAKQPAYLVGGFLIAESIDGVVRVSSSPRPGPEGRWRARDSDVDVLWACPELDDGLQGADRPVDDCTTCFGAGHEPNGSPGAANLGA